MWVEVSGGELYIEQAGTGSPLLLLHGWTLNHRMFEPQITKLSEHFNVITYDRRGFGQSRAVPNLALEMDDMDRILTALSLGPIHLFGASQGARIAVRYAVTRMHRIRSLLLQGAIVDGLAVTETEAERIPLEEYAQLACAGQMNKMRKRWLAHPLLAVAPEHASARRLLNNMVSEYSGADLLDFSAKSFQFTEIVINKLAELHCPLLLLTGANELPSRREYARKLLEIIPDGREEVFEQSGHLCNMTEACLFNERVINFCSKVDAGELPSRTEAFKY